jgi:hypothetical protein
MSPALVGRAEIGVRLSPICRKATGWDNGIECPDVEILDAGAAMAVASAAAKIVAGSALGKYDD